MNILSCDKFVKKFMP